MWSLSFPLLPLAEGGLPYHAGQVVGVTRTAAGSGSTDTAPCKTWGLCWPLFRHTDLKIWAEGYSVVSVELFYFPPLISDSSEVLWKTLWRAWPFSLNCKGRTEDELHWTKLVFHECCLSSSSLMAPEYKYLHLGIFLLKWCAILCEGWKLLGRSCFKTSVYLDLKEVDSEIGTIQQAVSWRREVLEACCMAALHASGPLL